MFTKSLSQGNFFFFENGFRIILNRGRELKQEFQYTGEWLKIKEEKQN